MKQTRLIVTILLLVFACAVNAPAEDVFYNVQLGDLELTDGSLPRATRRYERRMRQRIPALRPYAVLQGGGEAYVSFNGFNSLRNGMAGLSLVARTPRKGSPCGILYVPKPDCSGMDKLHFRFRPVPVPATDAKSQFFRVKKEYYSSLLDRRLPGSAWFRHQVREAEQALSSKKTDVTSPSPRGGRRGRRGRVDLAGTYSLFTGGRAVSENLQLDRVLRIADQGETPVDVNSLEGITIKEMDWQGLIAGRKHETDPLAKAIPADQYALIFPTFQSLVTMVDESKANGTPVLRMVEPRSEDALTHERYEKQLCLSLNAVTREFGKHAVSGVALTGSDPYLRTGTDLAVIFETKKTNVIKALMQANLQMAMATIHGAKSVQGKINGFSWSGGVSPDRELSCYVAVVNTTVVVANSLHQLRRIIDVVSGKEKSIASTPEYTFFRLRYPRGESDETAFLILPDAAIRQWCGPRWRIAASRRTRAAAIMAELQAQHLDDLVSGAVQAGPIQNEFKALDIGKVSITPKGIRSSKYNSLTFLTPIAEMKISTVTKSEAEAYSRWRNNYQRNWSRMFDPIAIRFTVGRERLGLDLTVMPLIMHSEYNEFMGISKGGKITQGAGDPHKEALLHFIMSLNPQSTRLQGWGNFLSMGAHPPEGPSVALLAWMGESIGLYADEDPFWEVMRAAEDMDKFMEKELHRLPIAANIEVKNAIKLAIFLTTVRTFVEQSAPGLTSWEALSYKEQPYVRVRSAPAEGEGLLQKLTIYYATTPKSLVITLNEDLLKRALDRQAQRKKDKKEGRKASVEPWLGENVALHAGSGAFDVFQKLSSENFSSMMQLRCWGNIPILNELKAMFPDRDPVRLHEQYWQTRLVCPGGGNFVWNKDWNTFESTIYGHPGLPKKGLDTPPTLLRFKNGSFGLTFEENGLRAKVTLTR